MRRHLVCAAVIPLCALGLNACDDPTKPVENSPSPPLFSITVGAEEQITSDPSRQQRPGISGDHIMWVDERNARNDIYTFDLVLGIETQVTTDPLAHVGLMPPMISGDRIVWEDYRYGASHVFMYDFLTGSETQITDGKLAQMCPAISGDRIVWDDRRNSPAGSPPNGDIYLYDIGENTEVQITSDPSHQFAPSISGDRVVWVDQRTGTPRIRMFNLADNTETEVPTDPSLQLGKILCPAVAISGTILVWADFRNSNGDNGDIYMFDLATSVETQLTGDPGDQRRPAIFGDRIVWQDRREGVPDVYDIYMLDLASQTTAQVTTSGEAYEPAIFGDRIVWSDWRTGEGDIYTVGFSTAIEPSIEVMVEQVGQFVTAGAIDNAGVAHALLAHLEQAGAAINRGTLGAAANKLNAFINFVNAQSGKHLTPEAAEQLIQMANGVIAQTQNP